MRCLSNTLRGQKGSVLAVGLLTLALLTLIGIAATTTSTLESQVAGNDRQQKEAFYAAEVALVVGENVVATLPNRAELQEDTKPGRYARGTQPAWDELNWDDTDSEAVLTDAIPQGLRQVAANPRYTIEERLFRRDSYTIGIGVPTGVYQFNITGRGTGGDATAEAVLQTIFAMRYD
ncbi:MAG: hypothetical protein KatS3mg131_2784 [Candidatus Tectimicrobiota bacterium]|nr:MAG: hypothetical protein KatS3mg131_2784 [Candidatus Tectomicrobia bacterium]